MMTSETTTMQRLAKSKGESKSQSGITMMAKEKIR